MSKYILILYIYFMESCSINAHHAIYLLLTKHITEGKTGKGAGKRKRRQGKSREEAAQHKTRAQTGTKAPGKGKDKSAKSRETETPPEQGKGTAGDVPG